MNSTDQSRQRCRSSDVTATRTSKTRRTSRRYGNERSRACSICCTKYTRMSGDFSKLVAPLNEYDRSPSSLYKFSCPDEGKWVKGTFGNKGSARPELHLNMGTPNHPESLWNTRPQIPRDKGHVKPLPSSSDTRRQRFLSPIIRQYRQHAVGHRIHSPIEH